MSYHNSKMVHRIRSSSSLEIHEFVIAVVRQNLLERISVYYVTVREGAFSANNLYYLKFMRDGSTKNLIPACHSTDG